MAAPPEDEQGTDAPEVPPTDEPPPTEPPASGDGGIPDGFQHLVHAVFSAGVAAKRMVAAQQVKDFHNAYFDEQGEAKTLKMGGQDIPLMTLVNHQTLDIETFDIEFEVILGKMQKNQDGGSAKHEVTADLGGGSSQNKAKVSISFKRGEPAEGIARINNQQVLKIKEQQEGVADADGQDTSE